jgi:hypothetical protein
MRPVPSSDSVYHYEPGLGRRGAAYIRANVAHPEARAPEVAGRLLVNIEGETVINTMIGRRIERWRAAAGTPCVILGYWDDDTVHLRWPAIRGSYRVDGRFPLWVVEYDPHTRLAGGGHMLRANNPPALPRGMPGRMLALLVLVVLVLLALAFPPTRDALTGLVTDVLGGVR